MAPPFFLKDITCLTRMQVILKLLEDSSSKIKVSKIWALWAGSHENRINKAGQMVMVTAFYENIWGAFW